jgi:hypothetical protein
VELVDTQDLGSCAHGVRVRVPPSALCSMAALRAAWIALGPGRVVLLREGAGLPAHVSDRVPGTFTHHSSIDRSAIRDGQRRRRRLQESRTNASEPPHPIRPPGQANAERSGSPGRYLPARSGECGRNRAPGHPYARPVRQVRGESARHDPYARPVRQMQSDPGLQADTCPPGRPNDGDSWMAPGSRQRPAGNRAGDSTLPARVRPGRAVVNSWATARSSIDRAARSRHLAAVALELSRLRAGRCRRPGCCRYRRRRDSSHR